MKSGRPNRSRGCWTWGSTLFRASLPSGTMRRASGSERWSSASTSVPPLPVIIMSYHCCLLSRWWRGPSCCNDVVIKFCLSPPTLLFSSSASASLSLLLLITDHHRNWKSPEDDLYWSLDLSFGATMRLTCVASSEMSCQLLDGRRFNLKQTYAARKTIRNGFDDAPILPPPRSVLLFNSWCILSCLSSGSLKSHLASSKIEFVPNSDLQKYYHPHQPELQVISRC